MLWLTCTHGRYRCLQRNLQCYLDQSFTGQSIMYICNSGTPLKAGDLNLPYNKNVHIDNCGLMSFKSVGEKYQHAVEMALRLYPKITSICSADDDDIFLPHHLAEGWYGLNKAHLEDMRAYKPKYSYFRFRDTVGAIQISKAENTLEPSIFADADWVLEHGYAPVSIRYHQQWLDPLIEQNKILIAENGVSTLIYNWGDNTTGPDSWNIYKMSGSGQDTTQNFIAHSRTSQDMGNGILTPSGDNSSYYNLIGAVSGSLTS